MSAISIRSLALFGALLALTHAVFGFGVERLRHRGRSTLVGQGNHPYLPFGAAVVDIQQVTGTNTARRFASIPIQANPSPLDSVCCQ